MSQPLDINDYDALIARYGKYLVLELMQFTHKYLENEDKEKRLLALEQRLVALHIRLDETIKAQSNCPDDGWRQAWLAISMCNDMLQEQNTELRNKVEIKNLNEYKKQ